MKEEFDLDPNFEKVFDDFLEERYSPKKDSFWTPETGRYHASDTSKCLRAIYYKHVYGPRGSKSSYPNFHIGNKIEDMAKEILSKYYGWDFIKNSIRIKIGVEDFEIVGQTDLVLLGYNMGVLDMFEIKSTSGISYVKGSPKDIHVMQTHPYMKALGLDSCKIIYLQKSDFQVEAHKVKFDENKYNKGIDRIKKLHNHIKEEKPPEPKPYASFQCGWCNYSPLCPKGGD